MSTNWSNSPKSRIPLAIPPHEASAPSRFVAQPRLSDRHRTERAVRGRGVLRGVVVRVDGAVVRCGTQSFGRGEPAAGHVGVPAGAGRAQAALYLRIQEEHGADFAVQFTDSADRRGGHHRREHQPDDSPHAHPRRGHRLDGGYRRAGERLHGVAFHERPQARPERQGGLSAHDCRRAGVGGGCGFRRGDSAYRVDHRRPYCGSGRGGCHHRFGLVAAARQPAPCARRRACGHRRGGAGAVHEGRRRGAGGPSYPCLGHQHD